MRIAFLLPPSRLDPNPPSPIVSPVTREVIDRLTAKGARVDTIIPEDRTVVVTDLYPMYDLYVIDSETPLTLSLVGALAALGGASINTYRACSLAGDKIASTAVLASAGIPVPPAWVAGRADLFGTLLEEGALWIEPQRDTHCQSTYRVGSAAELDGAAVPIDPYGLPLPLLAQRQVLSDGHRLKVSVIGNQVMPQVPLNVHATALACGQILGLELYEVDFLVAGEQFFVVDVNPFPDYAGVPQAAIYLAEHIYQRATRVIANGMEPARTFARKEVLL